MDKCILITDVGSTTTKAILVGFQDGRWTLKGLANAPTTVEKPFEDVMVGVMNAVRDLQKKTDTLLLTSPEKINPEMPWLSTSSAGGGLQILVIGLTRVESAASAGRAAYGVGGVLLDTIAVDDGRSVIQQMHAIEEKHPDIVLMSGGYDGGAYASVLRQAEILSYCEIKPKYSLKSKIPLIFAGNKDAAVSVQSILQDNFEVHILENIRPAEDVERTGHVTELVHELFLNNVMQQAPGYKALSEMVSDPVIPTPLGVMAALKKIGETSSKNILAVDIGGATTDVYSNIFGNFYRTVSANYGMSYNLCNVFAKAEMQRLQQWLHPKLTETDLRNYIGNKMLYPTVIPDSDGTLHIEQALARIALQLSLQQHLQMNFSISRIGLFVRIKNDDLDPFHEQFYREKLNERAEFKLQDFDMLIGAGGVISHAPKAKQAAMMLVDGLQPRGITELWRDRHFVTPHLGKLSQVDGAAAMHLLEKECLEPLCLCIRPLPQKLRTGKTALSIELSSSEGTRNLEIQGNQLIWIDNSVETQVLVKAHGSIRIAYEQKEQSAVSNLPILIDTRIAGQYPFEEMNKVLGLYHDTYFQAEDKVFAVKSLAVASIKTGTHKRTFSLPYAGIVHVQEGDKVNSDTLLGENLYDPPRIYILQIFRGREAQINPQEFEQNLLVKIGDEVKNGQLIYKEKQSFLESIISTSNFNFNSPVRGRVERIDNINGTILLREIQDYSFEPYVIDLSAKISCKPGFIKGCLRKRLGDFVTTGELLAVKSWKKHEQIYHSPITGTITDVNTKKGTITIQYIRKDLQLKSYLQAEVTSVVKNRFIELQFEGTVINGSIGFGKMAEGKVIWYEQFAESELVSGSIAIFPSALNKTQLGLIAKNQLSAIIVPSLAEKDVVELLGYELGVGITADEAIPFSIILISGFGEMSYSAEIGSMLISTAGKHGVVFPQTQIRAGVVRPSLVIQ